MVLRVPVGEPTTPVNGDIWLKPTGLVCQPAGTPIPAIGGGGTWSHPAGEPVSMANGAEVNITHPAITAEEIIVSVWETMTAQGAKATVDHTTEVSASGTSSSSSDWNATLASWRAVQASGGPYYWQPAGSPVGAWWKYAFVAAKTIATYTIKINLNYSLSGWTFAGSNDNSSWTTLDTRTGITWASGESKDFTIASPASYAYYRLTIDAAISDVVLERIWMYEVGETTTELCSLGSYLDSMQFGVKRVDATTTTVKNTSGATKSVHITVLTPNVPAPSDAGLVWTSISHTPDLSLMCIGARGSILIAGASAGGSDNILRSTDNGATWSALNLWTGSAPGIYGVTAILWTGTYWIICGNNGSGACMAATSTDDGDTWSVVNTGFASYSAAVIVKGGGTLALVISGDYNVYISTDDGVTWSGYNTGLAACYDVIWTGARFVAAGYDGVSRSTDGLSWTAKTDGIAAAHSWYGIADSGTELVAVGYGASTMRSLDGGVTWVAGGDLPAGVYPNIRCVVFTGGFFLVLGSTYGSRSPTGEVWEAAYDVPSNNIARFAVSTTKVVAVGYTGANSILRSSNGE